MLISSFGSVMQYIGYIIIAILVLLIMVTIHELGHYIAGRILKFKIVEFSVGFGPKLFSKKNKRGEIVSLRAVPLGGFCAFYGEESEEKKIIDPFDAAPKPETGDKENYFNNQKPWKRIIVFIAGGLFNIISAFLFSLLFILVVGYTVPKIEAVYDVVDASSGAVIENPNGDIIKEGDIIIAINGKKISAVNSYSKLSEQAAKKGIEKIVYTVERTVNGEVTVIELTGFQKVTYVTKDSAGAVKENTGIGIYMNGVKENVNFFTALWQMFPVTWDFGVSVLQALGGLFTGAVGFKDLSGPVGTIGMMATMTQSSMNYFFILLPLIAVNLGIFNLLPIPALDGSKVVFAVIEWIRKKPVKQSVETMIHFVGLIALLGFVVFIDIFNLFTRL